MKYNPMIKIITVLSAAALLTGAVSVSASAVVIDGEEVAATYDATVAEGSSDDLPSSYSSLDKGYVTPAKSQSYNDCWAYSATAAFESKLLRDGVVTDTNAVRMSELHLNLWATTRTNGKGWIRSISDSGYCYIATGYYASWQGGIFESDAADILPDSNIKGDEVPTDRAKYGVTAMRYVSRNNMDGIKRAIMENGGVTTGYSHKGIFMNNNTSYYMPESYTEPKNGHQVEIVGWDDNYDKSNFKSTPKNNGAWLMKSSWGSGSPLNGFYWISYETKYLFDGKAYEPCFAIEQYEEITDRKKMIQNEIFGATYEVTLEGKNEGVFLNRLTFDKDFYVLDKVIFETKAESTEYELYLVPEADGAPSSDTDTWKLIGSGTTDHAGYICTDINNIELTQSTASIAVKLKNNGGDAKIGVDEWVDTSNGAFKFIPESEFGMSYFYDNGKMTDLMQWYKDTLNNDMGGTLVIKGLTFKPESGDVNLDSNVDILDVTLIQQYLAELEQLSPNQKKLADFNGDGEIDISDATAIQVKIAS